MGTAQQKDWQFKIDAALGDGIIQEYTGAMDVLFAAMLREPFKFYTVANKISPAWFEHTRHTESANALFAQYLSGKRYSISSVAYQAGSNQSELVALSESSVDIDLELAYELTEPVYKRFVEYMVAQEAMRAVKDGDAAEEVKARTDAARRKMDDVSAGNSAEQKREFETWVNDKIAGKPEVFECTPHLCHMVNIGLLKGFRPGSLTIVAGRPGMGKTQLALNFADHFAKNRLRGQFFSLEMSELELRKRLMGIISGVNPESDWSMLQDSDYVGITNAMERLDKSPLSIINNAYTLNHILASIRSAHYREPLKYVIVDYIQLVKATVNRNSNREQEIATISRELKLIATSLNIPVIALSQLSRDVEKRGGSKRPQLSDLRESGAIEQDADNVLFPFRPEYYGILEDENGQSLRGKGEIIVAKQRAGKIGKTDSTAINWSPVLGYTDAVTESFAGSEPVFTRPDLDKQDIPF